MLTVVNPSGPAAVMSDEKRMLSIAVKSCVLAVGLAALLLQSDYALPHWFAILIITVSVAIFVIGAGVIITGIYHAAIGGKRELPDYNI